MSERLLQVNFKIGIPATEYAQAADQLAGAFAEVPGLVWKIWILNEAESEAGGIYLFEDARSLEAYLESPLAAQVRAHPAFSEMSARPFAIMPGPTALARGPVAGVRERSLP
jgi:hypothetical protein